MGWVHSVLSVMHLFSCIGAVACLAAWCLGTRAVEQSGHWFDIMSCQTRLDSSFFFAMRCDCLEAIEPPSALLPGARFGIWDVVVGDRCH